MNSIERAKKASLAIALLRTKQTNFTYSELLQGLKNSGCPYYARMPQILKSLNLVSKTNGIYVFSKKEPIYYHVLEIGLQPIVVSKPKLTEAIAINFLKEKGFKIFKPNSEV